MRDAARRPLTFAFNGGPGAASVYLNLGLAGPRIVDFGPDGRDGAAAKLVDNPDSWLAFTDLVMIDPIGTGWSRTAKPDDAKNFWGVRSDANVLAKVIALYVAKNSRGASPKYLLGESYGGFRAAKVARALQSDQGIVVTGIVMVSPLLEASFQWGSSQYALGAALHFPTLVATELERTKKFTPEAMAEAERFAMNEYLPTLAGRPPTGDKAKAFYGRVAEMTGLPVDVVAKSRGWVRNAYLQHLRANGQIRQQLRRDIRRARSLSGKRQARRRRSDPRRLHAGAVRRLRRLCPRRARLQDRHDLHPAGASTFRRSGNGATAASRRVSATICANCWRSRHRSGCWWRTAAPTSSRPMA